MERTDVRGDAGEKILLVLHPAEDDITIEPGSKVDRYNTLSVQLEWISITGTKDGTFVLQQSNYDNPTSTQWDDMGLAQTISTSDGSVTLADVSFTGKRFRIVYTANNISGGDINAKAIAKR